MTDVGRFTGRHALAEFSGVEPALLDDEHRLRALLGDAVTAAGATVLDVMSHRFAPHGVTVLALLAESHASIHTYPEHGRAFVDVFTCGSADPDMALNALATGLGGTIDRRTIGRGTAASEPVGAGLTRTWELTDVVVDARSAFQHYVIGHTAQGVSLFSEGERQSTEATQLVYHEALTIPPLLLADRRERVLIVGSSEGVASQLAVAAGATRVDHVDIDAEVVRACAEHLPYGYTSAELARAEAHDGPVRIHYLDGWAFLAGAARDADGPRYDVVIVDLPDETTDPAAQHNRLYGDDFLALCLAVLAPGGVVSTQAGCPTVWRNDTLRTAWARFRRTFATVAYHGSDEHEWAFLSGRADPLGDPHIDPVDVMAERLRTLPYRPVSIDEPALRSSATPPISLRRN